MNMRTKLAITAALVIIMAAASVGIIQAAMAKETPYQAGYDHGCNDGKISNADDRYINQPDKGPSNHTPEFMSGYNAGFSTCSDGGTPNSGGNTDNSRGGSSSNPGQSQSQSYKDGFAVGKSRAIDAIQELHDRTIASESCKLDKEINRLNSMPRNRLGIN
jgi:hypothetical protein